MNPLRRRFVNLLAEEHIRSRVCSLRRLDVSEHLFYPSTVEAEAAKPAISSLPSLPAPTINFQPSVPGNVEKTIFALASSRRSTEGRILWRSHDGHTILYDADSNTNRSLPGGLHYTGGRRPIVISIPVVRRPRVVAPGRIRKESEEDDLYVMSSSCGASRGTFQVLRFGNTTPAWFWHPLPPPPLPPPCWDSEICSHAVLDGGRIICVTASSAAGTGTYLFDTWKHKWMQPATSDWKLPFWAASHYVPDLKLWLGISRDDMHHLCASPDLDAAAALAALNDAEPSPTVKHLWKEGLETPEGWNTASASLINLGDGRFCISKILDEVVPEEDEFSSVSYMENVGRTSALRTGVEIVRSRGDHDPNSNSSDEEGFRMVVHKSLSYIFHRESISWVI